MDGQAGTTAEASFDSKLVVEKAAFHHYVPHGSTLICSYADDGTLLQSLVRPPIQSSLSKRLQDPLTANAAGKRFNYFPRFKHLFASYRA